MKDIKEVQVTKYETSDGVQFNLREDAINYQFKINNEDEIREISGFIYSEFSIDDMDYHEIAKLTRYILDIFKGNS